MSEFVIVLKENSRGFMVGTFIDRYQAKCSIQESSLATEDCIWLGVDSDPHNVDVSWGRMHLTQEMVQALLPILQEFAETGFIGRKESVE